MIQIYTRSATNSCEKDHKTKSSQDDLVRENLQSFAMISRTIGNTGKFMWIEDPELTLLHINNPRLLQIGEVTGYGFTDGAQQGCQIGLVQSQGKRILVVGLLKGPQQILR